MKLKPYPEYKDSGVPWLGEIPKHWSANRLKRVCRLGYGDSLAGEARLYGDVPVYGSNGRVGSHNTPNTLGPCIIVGRKGSFGKVNYSSQPAFAIDTTFFVDARLTKENLRWLYYALSWVRLDDASRDSAIPGLDRGEAYERLIPTAPMEEQHQIAAFLDSHDHRINRLIRAKRRLIELLNEQKQAIIHNAVTGKWEVRRVKGDNGEVTSHFTPRPLHFMKSSGIDWLGEVPEHWKVRRIKQVSKILRGKFSHRPRNDPDMYDGPYPFIQTGDVSRAAKLITAYSQTLNERGLSVSKMFPSGTLVMTIAANIGDVAMLTFDACFPDSVIGFVPSKSLGHDYLYYVFLSMKKELLREAPVNTQGNLNIERIGALSMPVPPLDEQGRIVLTIEKSTLDLSVTINRAQREIDLLREYRTRLIADVVTGKLDVRSVKFEGGSEKFEGGSLKGEEGRVKEEEGAEWFEDGEVEGLDENVEEMADDE